MAATSAVLLPLCSSSAGRRQQGEGQRQQRQTWQRGGLPCNMARVVRQDGEFLMAKLELVAAPLRRFQRRVSKALDDFFWLRFLEEEGAAPRVSPSWPTPSYPGLSGMDLLMADLEAVKFYVNYLRCMSQSWSVPLPEIYDPQTVDHYFKCRPHILAVRVLEVFSSFVTAAIKMKASRSKFDSDRADKDDNREASHYYMGQLLKESILNLGPTFIKVGQSLSTRPDIIGSEIAKVRHIELKNPMIALNALSELYDKVPSFPRSVAMKTIEDELGCPVEDAFSYISEEPVAAASFGQVYQGCTRDGYLVAVKVQRPDLLHSVVQDIYILRIGLGILRKLAKRKSDPRLYADELGKGFIGELDYRLEAANAIEFREAHAKYPFISVPIVFKHLSGKKVLTMEWLFGENPNDLLSLSRGSAWGSVDYTQLLDAKKHVLDLVNKGVEASLVQLLETGILHADPHPGNLRYTPEGRIGFLDFGLLCRMQKKHQLAILASIVHIVNGDWGALVQDLTEMDVVPRTANIHRVTMDLEEALGGVAFKDGIPDIKFSRVLGKIWSIAFKYHFRMPPYYTLVLRSLASLEGLAVAADQNFKAFQAAYPYVVQKLLYDNSAETRRILYSVVFNKRREFQWQKISLFLKMGSLRTGRNGHKALGTSFPYGIHDRQSALDIASLILKLLPSKDGVVLRRLLMNVDAVSLARAMVSDEAVFFRQQVSRAVADVIYQWMTSIFRRQGTRGQHERDPMVEAQQISSGFSPFLLATLKDRRVKVISHRVLTAIKHDPALILRVCWVTLTMFLSSSAVALHRLLVSSAENLASPLLSVSRLFAVSS